MLNKMKQIIIARKDLNINEFAAHVATGAMAFLTYQIKHRASVKTLDGYNVSVLIDRDTMNNWICDSFTKAVYAVEGDNLYDIISIAERNNLKENRDFFLVCDDCNSLVCVGFRPLPDNIIECIINIE